MMGSFLPGALPIVHRDESLGIHSCFHCHSLFWVVGTGGKARKGCCVSVCVSSGVHSHSNANFNANSDTHKHSSSICAAKVPDILMTDKKKAKVLRMPISGTPASLLAEFLDQADRIKHLTMVMEFEGDDDSGQEDYLLVCWSKTNTAMLCLMSMVLDEKIRSLMHSDED